jgi:hypothetical protein
MSTDFARPIFMFKIESLLDQLALTALVGFDVEKLTQGA